ncbi:Tiny macrocysts protein B [Tetrabaena socialis]|uniref:Tiny macrocysts protein B n=1 Tax=Tetrabaena socialis TaxID=47790 RepID=A0A2J8AI14_9CHLO|nr:Tiny macrocysts protein B [Tetrabaena socialis]|eukprot:PNH12150.1 Tiny macrocysts protein B [Tetrabaena socialis]
MSRAGSSYVGSVASSQSSGSRRVRAAKAQQDGEDFDADRRSTLENGIFGVLFTLSKENNETRIKIRWVLLKILLDAWQLFITVVNPMSQGWDINPGGRVWAVVSVLSFRWLGDVGYGAYLALLYSMVALLAINIGLCVWVAWCFKEQKFPAVWPIKMLRVFSSIFFQAFDVTSLTLLQLGITCRYAGNGPRMRFDLFPEHSCATSPHLLHAIVSALSLVLFVTIALFLNMAEVEVNPLGQRPLALGHSGAEVMAFAIKVLLTLVDVFLPWPRVSACAYLALSLALAWQYLRWASSTSTDAQLKEIAKHLDDPRDVEIVARICRKTDKEGHPDPEAIGRAHQIVQAGLASFPTSPFVALYHANFMIDVLGVAQGGARRIGDARKLKPGLMCRFIIFVRNQMATQRAAGSSANTDGTSMDLLGYVEYQRKQRNVVRLHREALHASCIFWKAIDATSVSFTRMSKALNKIENSVSQAQTAYRVTLEQYGSNPKLVRLYGKFLERIKNDPWGAQEYFAEADRLEEMKSGDAQGPRLPDGTPLSRMDEMAIGVLVMNSIGEVQIANTRAHAIFGYKRGMLDTKPLSLLLAPHEARRVSDILAGLVAALGNMTSCSTESVPESEPDVLVVGMHSDRVAFPLKLSIRKASGVGEDSTFIALLGPMPLIPGVATLWAVPNGTVTACDPHFFAITGWKASDVNGVGITTLLSLPSSPAARSGGPDVEMGAAAPGQTGTRVNDTMNRLLGLCDNNTTQDSTPCFLTHKYDDAPMECYASVKCMAAADTPGSTVCEIRVQLVATEPAQLLVVNRKGIVRFASTELVVTLKDKAAAPHGAVADDALAPQVGSAFDYGGRLEAYNLSDFLPPFWKEMHPKLMKETTTTTPTIAAAHGAWSCRGAAAQGPTLELRTMSGKAVYMHVRVATVESHGELTHCVRLKKSSLEEALGERRLRLSITPDGRISGASKETPKSLFGLDPSQVHVVEPTDEDPDDMPPAVFVDLWPAAAVTGVVQLDGSGRITAVLEEATRPAGLLFGLPGQSLIGQMLLGSGLLMLPPGRSGHTDLLTLHGAKKSSMKTAKDNGDIKVGPVHLLQGKHSDGAGPLLIELQVVGKPGRKQPATVLLRMHAAPMVSSGAVPSLALVPSLAMPSASFAANVVVELPAPQQLTTAQGFAGPLDEFEREVGHLASFSPLLSRPGTAVALAAESLRVARSVTGPDSPSGMPRPFPSSPPAILATPSDVNLLDSGVAAAITALEAVGRNKLSNLVKSMGIDKAASGSLSLPRRHSQGLAAGFDRSNGISRRASQLRVEGQPSGGLHVLPGSTAGDIIEAISEAGDAVPEGLDKKAIEDGAVHIVAGSGSSNSSGSERNVAKGIGRAARVSTWVVSKGAFYQNANEKGVEDAARLSDDEVAKLNGNLADPRAPPQYNLSEGARVLGPGLAVGSVAGSEDDDAASEGGMSAMSAQTGNSGAEYKRGKRFRKLAKLMDSSIAQQIQQRLRTNTLLTVALLVIVHVVCFSLTVVFLKQQESSMLQLGRSGEAQRSVHQVLADVRTLDVLSRNMSAHNLYTVADAPRYADRISRVADDYKGRLNDILESHNSRGSTVLALFYFRHQQVWNGVAADGSDQYTNLTVKAFSTRFYAMAKILEQNALAWLRDGIHIADTYPGQMIIKSGPDLFVSAQQILDELLFEASRSSWNVKLIELIFLAVEGVAVTCIAAVYVAYLLRAVASQRYMLYGSFLLVPVGLTRALATQSTTLMLDGEDDEDDEDEEDAKETTATAGEAPEEDPKQKRRARVTSGGGATPDENRGTHRTSAVAAGLLDLGRSASVVKSQGGGRRNARGIAPLASTGGKRTLVADSRDTLVMLVPFVLWSILVIAVYCSAVVKMQGVVEAVAIHSVVNNMGARVERVVFFAQELAIAQTPQQVVSRQADLKGCLKRVMDACSGFNVHMRARQLAAPLQGHTCIQKTHAPDALPTIPSSIDCEQFPLVNGGLSYASEGLSEIFYKFGRCHRAGENLPCPGPDDRHYEMSRTGLDAMMQQFLISVQKMVTSSVPLGLDSAEFDFIYTVGGKDLLDGIVEASTAHNELIIELFQSILLYHIILFGLCFILFTGFIALLLNPLIKRVTKERRRIAELMAQLPLELDVEKLMSRALHQMVNTTETNTRGGKRPGMPSAVEDGEDGIAHTATVSDWKAIMRMGSNVSGEAPNGGPKQQVVSSQQGGGGGPMARRSSGMLHS